MKAPIRITNLPGAKEPTLAFDDQGTLHAAFGAGNTLYSTSQAAGAFGPPTVIAQAGHLALGMRRGPRLTFTKNNLVVSAIYGRQGGGRDGELLAWRSSDQAKSWSGPVTINDVPGATREGLHAMGAAPDGTLVCVWLDLREKGTTVFSSTSLDGGKSWSRNTPVYRSPSGTVCECCHVSVCFTASNELLVMFRNVLQGNRDMYLARSLYRGKSFTPAQKIGFGSWPLNACPMDGGMIAADPKQGIVSAWRREEVVYTCVPGKPEKRVEVGQQPWIAVGKTGSWCTWLVGRPGTLRLQGPTGSIQTLAEGANNPVLVSTKRGDVALAWSGPGGLFATELA